MIALKHSTLKNLKKKFIAVMLSVTATTSMLGMIPTFSMPENNPSYFITAEAKEYSISLYASKGNVNFNIGDKLVNKDYYATLQSDGNFVVYNKKTGKLIWSLGTNFGSSYSDYQLTLQKDGNLVLYAKKGNTRQWLWATGTNSSTYTTDRGYTFSLALSGTGQLKLTQSYQGRGYTEICTWYSGCYKNRWNVGQLYQSDYNQTLYCGTKTIATAGCALTSYTMIYNYYKGKSAIPTDLNNSRYVNNSGDTRFTGYKYVDYSFDYAELAAALRQGPVIVWITNSAGKTHYIVVNQCKKLDGTPVKSDFMVKDPGYRNINTLHEAMNNYYKSYLGRYYIWDCKSSF